MAKFQIKNLDILNPVEVRVYVAEAGGNLVPHPDFAILDGSTDGGPVQGAGIKLQKGYEVSAEGALGFAGVIDITTGTDLVVTDGTNTTVVAEGVVGGDMAQYIEVMNSPLFGFEVTPLNRYVHGGAET